MKLSPLVLGSVLAVVSVSEAFAQRSSSRGSSGSSSSGSPSSGSSSRGPSYNPSRGSSSPSSSSFPSQSRPSPSSSSSSSSNPRGPSYNPGRGNPGSSPSTSSTPSRPWNSGSVGSSSSSTTPRGPSYNPGRNAPSSPSTGSVGTPSAPRGPNYNPTRNAPTGALYGTPTTPGRVVIRGQNYNPTRYTARPYRPIRYTNYTVHAPYRYPYIHTIRYVRPYDYYSSIRRDYIYRYWLFEPVSYSYVNGYYQFDNYPYYVYNGYRHRYSSVDLCSYQLVDSQSNEAVKSFTETVCQAAYDTCALERDVANQSLSEVRYFCSERVDDELSNTSDDSVVFDPQPNPQPDDIWSAINNYLANRSYKEIWRDGHKKNRFAPKCEIRRVKKHAKKCKYVVKVAGQFYPDQTGSICSHDDSAVLAGCEVGTQKKNAGCLLKLAVSEGLCH